MVIELTKLYNTLSLIETKGENTKKMTQCLNFVEQLITNENIKKQQAQKQTENINNETTSKGEDNND